MKMIMNIKEVMTLEDAESYIKGSIESLIIAGYVVEDFENKFEIIISILDGEEAITTNHYDRVVKINNVRSNLYWCKNKNEEIKFNLRVERLSEILLNEIGDSKFTILDDLLNLFQKRISNVKSNI